MYATSWRGLAIGAAVVLAIGCGRGADVTDGGNGSGGSGTGGAPRAGVGGGNGSGGARDAAADGDAAPGGATGAGGLASGGMNGAGGSVGAGGTVGEGGAVGSGGSIGTGGAIVNGTGGLIAGAGGAVVVIGTGGAGTGGRGTGGVVVVPGTGGAGTGGKGMGGTGTGGVIVVPGTGGAGTGGAGTGGRVGTGGTPGTGGAGTGGRGTGGAGTGGAGTGGMGTGGTGTGGTGTGGRGTGGTGTGGAGTGGKGTGGVVGTGGSGVGGGAIAGNSVLERNNHPSRDGHFLQATLTRAAIGRMAADTAFNAAFTGNMVASPLFLQNGPGGTGAFYAVTTGNDVIALDETTGSILWSHNIGSSPSATGVSCGGIHPLGIISTPVIDAASRTIFVAGAIGTTSIARHEVHALSVDDGSERAGWPVDVSTMSSGGVTFSPPPQNQRSALSLVNGVLYVAYGGHVGDCGNYHGWVVAITIANPTSRAAWVTGGLQEGIWAPGGLASDGNGVFVMTGNGSANPHQDSEELLRLTGLATLTRNNQNIFFPTRWQAMDSGDLDLGSVNPLYVEIPGATPSKLVVAISKDGHMYLVDAANFGGMGGQVVDFMVAASGISIHAVPTAYRTAAGLHVAFTTDQGALCPSGGPTGRVMMSVLIPAGAPPAPQVVWCNSFAADDLTGPITTTTDGTSNATVWYINGGRLLAVDGDTGASVFGSSNTCSGVQRWTSPIAINGRIVVGGNNHLCSWSPH